MVLFHSRCLYKKR
ncbi:Protein CBG25293 [Caenorhabditis briggsae]|uniref:Protein CBG25293 n=1 Tax=Caenorhabditis briggsae TaxID=6238 RepID=B6IIG3_CAEBR|nr:Protein CBG25293 [Caenorhabditis briggsae]CAR99693.1 Protein CBG25293 [Caenorhabditis briggsae]